jgi:predicted RNA-binding Zn ribbon-like protein
MLKIDNNLLEELGLGSLSVEDKNKMLAHIYETLEMRVGMTLAKQMTNEQLDEFEGFIDSNNEEGALNWLETNFPNYKQVVADELEKLKVEIKGQALQIIANATQAAQTPVQPQAPVDPASMPPAQPQTPPAQADDQDFNQAA